MVGQPGKLLTEEDRACLAPAPLRVFPADEICALNVTELPIQQQALYTPDPQGELTLRIDPCQSAGLDLAATGLDTCCTNNLYQQGC